MALAASGVSALSAATPGEPPLLSIRFAPAGIEFSGRIDGEETAEFLARAARAARPGAPVINRGLLIDPSVSLPDREDLRSVLAELGVSIHEGQFALYDDALLIGGITDSRIALTAVQVRAAPLLEGRRLISRLCIVPTEDLPSLPVLLSTGEVEGPLLDLERYPSAAEAYVPPGLALSKLVPTLLLLADFETLRDGPAATERLTTLTPPPLRAVPAAAIELAEETAAAGEAEPGTGMAAPGAAGADSTATAGSASLGGLGGLAALLAASAEPQPSYVDLGSLRFARNTALLQAGQESAAAALLQRIRDEGHAGRRLLVQARRAREGEPALAEYLAERRADEAVALLAAQGVDPALLVIRNDLAPEAEIDEGEVRVVVEIPPPMAVSHDEEIPAASSATGEAEAESTESSDGDGS